MIRLMMKILDTVKNFYFILFFEKAWMCLRLHMEIEKGKPTMVGLSDRDSFRTPKVPH